MVLRIRALDASAALPPASSAALLDPPAARSGEQTAGLALGLDPGLLAVPAGGLSALAPLLLLFGSSFWCLFFLLPPPLRLLLVASGRPVRALSLVPLVPCEASAPPLL